MATLTTLVNFDGTNGAESTSDLIFDAAGDLFGTTGNGGANGLGTVFEIVKDGSSPTGYAGTPTTLVSFTGANGATPVGDLIADAAGNLFGTTFGGGPGGYGTVFEVVKMDAGYASTPTTLVNFDGTNGYEPASGLIFDAAGDLFGTTVSGAGSGTVFEIVKDGSSPTGYAGTPTTLVSFTGANGANPVGDLIFDGAGDLFGTTGNGGANGLGTVFEIVKDGSSSTGYASSPTTLVTFTDANGAEPHSGLIFDAAGDLFGTTRVGGANGDGTVFEIVKDGSSPTGYASSPTTLVSFTGANGADLRGGLIFDAAGDLFGTTFVGGANGDGTVFEIVKDGSSPTGYAGTPTTLVSFTGADGFAPSAGLIADAAGDLFGTTESGGANGHGTVFEIAGSGFVVAHPAPAMLNAVKAANGLTTLSGTAEPGSSLSIFDDGKPIGGVTVAADGTWSFQANVTGNVVHKFTETSLDQNGSSAPSAGVTLYTPSANKQLAGGMGDDVLIGRPNDTLTGGNGGADTFVFNPGFGKETITGFNVSQDVIAFDRMLFTDATAGQVLSQTHDSSKGAVIVVDAADTITLPGVTVAQLQAHDFQFFDASSAANVALLGQYTAASFVQPAGSSGGTLIHDVPQETQTQMLVQPHQT